MASRDKISSVRGMNDLLPPDTDTWRFFEAHCRTIFDLYGYKEIRTPILEPTALFSRSVGETTDIVEKEMYTFDDRKGRSLTMRPEMTASCVRSYVQHSVHKLEPVTRWFYVGPMFRYERMQTGRYRQFWQIGVEVFGIAEPTIDVEIISMLHGLYEKLGVASEVQINSVGDDTDRPAYRAKLVEFLQPHVEDLCPDCVRRLEKNPLRILDCKVNRCKAIVADAPSVLDSLGDASRAHFDAVQRGLGALSVPYVVTPDLVRGLDYYTGTVFELVSDVEALGKQSTIVAGGRYNGLVEDLGGPSVPAIGFALGIERALLIMQDRDADDGPDVFFVCHGAAARDKALELTHFLRTSGYRTDMEHRDVSMKAQFKRANKLGAHYAATIGENELASGAVRLKDMQTGEERDVSMALLVDALRGD
jgi:histidyl-tRNA synthetase